MHRGQKYCADIQKRGKEEKKDRARQFINRSFAQASTTFTSPSPLFFAFTVPIQDYKMWNWPNENACILGNWGGFIWILGQYAVGYFTYLDHEPWSPSVNWSQSRPSVKQMLVTPEFVTFELEDISDSREEQSEWPHNLTDLWHSSDVSCRIFFWKIS